MHDLPSRDGHRHDPPPARPAWEAPPWPPCQGPRAECPPLPRDVLLEWEERRADGTAGFGVILSTVVEEREAPSQRPTLAPGRLTSYMPRGTTCESGTPPSLPQLGRMCVSVSGVSSVLFSISWAWDSIVSCVAAEM